jgi:hypothetical protein
VVRHISVVLEYAILCKVAIYSIRKESSKKCRSRVILRVYIASVPSKYISTHVQISNVFIFKEISDRKNSCSFTSNVR